MRIVLVAPAFPKLSETFVVAQFLGLLERGFDVHVLCDRSDVEAWERFPELQATAGVRARVHVRWPHEPRRAALLRWLPSFARSVLVRPGATLRYFVHGWQRFGFGVLKRFYLDQDLIRLRPDVLHFEFGALAHGRMDVKHLLGCRATVSFRGYDINLAGLERADYYEAIWRDVDRIHFLGEALRRRALARGCPREIPFDLIPPSVAPALFEPGSSGSPEGRALRVLSVGRLTWEKGYEYALLAQRVLLDRGVDCEYAIVGDGDYLEMLAFRRDQLGLEGTVSFLGALAPEAVRERLRWADVCLHAAVSEGFGNAVLEAQAMARPVVCTDAGGLPENVVDGETGFVVPRRDPEALAERLAQLAADPEAARKLGEAGRRRVEEHFDLAQQAVLFDRFFRAALEGASWDAVTSSERNEA